MKFKIDLNHLVKDKWPGTDSEYDRSVGSVHVVDDDSDEARSEREYAFIHDENGNAMAWYSGCGSHQLTITRSFQRWLQQDHDDWGRETTLMNENHFDPC